MPACRKRSRAGRAARAHASLGGSWQSVRLTGAHLLRPAACPPRRARIAHTFCSGVPPSPLVRYVPAPLSNFDRVGCPSSQHKALTSSWLMHLACRPRPGPAPAVLPCQPGALLIRPRQ
jgi:hypothetical protein